MAKVAPKKKEETNLEIVPKESGTLSKISSTGVEAYKRSRLAPQDIQIPRLLVMQGQSQKVLSGEAKFGELRDNVDNKLMAEPSSPLDIIPLYLESVWITVEIEKNGNRKFVGVMPTAGNENLPFEEVQDGKNLVRMKTIVLCCLAQNEIEPGESFPYLVSFRSTSFRAGKKLGTIFAKNEVKERDPWSVVLELSVTKTKNDKGTFAVLDVKQKRAATELEVSTAAKWFGKLNQSNVKADYSDMETPEESAAPDSEGKF